MNNKLKYFSTEIFESAILALLYTFPVALVLFIINWGEAYWFIYFLVYLFLFILILTLKLKKINQDKKIQ